MTNKKIIKNAILTIAALRGYVAENAAHDIPFDGSTEAQTAIAPLEAFVSMFKECGNCGNYDHQVYGIGNAAKKTDIVVCWECYVKRRETAGIEAECPPVFPADLGDDLAISENGNVCPDCGTTLPICACLPARAAHPQTGRHTPETTQKVTFETVKKNQETFLGSKTIGAAVKKAQNAPKVRFLCSIAAEVTRDWGQKMSAYAEPYVMAMATLDDITDHYGMDSGQEIVARFLCNASSWRGETARRVKAELQGMLKGVRK